MNLTKRNMPETMYRASRCCRILGNPMLLCEVAELLRYEARAAYLILRFLGKNRKTPTEISQGLHISLPAASITLRELRNVDLVRYETSGITREYWVKDRKVLDVLDALESLTKIMRKKRL